MLLCYVTIVAFYSIVFYLYKLGSVGRTGRPVTKEPQLSVPLAELYRWINTLISRLNAL